MNYSYDYIEINQREVALNKILSGAEPARTPFEHTTFEFIARWLKGETTFEQHTSGSTGFPKKISLHRQQMVASAQRTLRALPVTRGNTALVCLNTEYIAGKMMLVRALEFNLKIAAVEPSSNPLQSVTNSQIIHFAAFVPLQLDTMLQQPQQVTRLNLMNAILIGGAAVSNSLHKKIQTLTCPVFATYGMTETVSNIAVQKINGKTSENFFRPLPGISLKTDNRNCLVITVPELPQPVITNDVVELNNDQSFRVLGRWDNVINSGGFKIVPERLEQQAEDILRGHGKINTTFIFGGLPHDVLGQQLILIIEGSTLEPDVEKQIIDELKKKVKSFEVPKQIKYLQEFSYTPSGKINRPEVLRRVL